MKLFDTLKDALGSLAGLTFEFGQDNDGQIVLYTNLFEHSDGTVHNEPEWVSITLPTQCEGHPEDPSDVNSRIGETFFCDGSCR